MVCAWLLELLNVKEGIVFGLEAAPLNGVRPEILAGTDEAIQEMVAAAVGVFSTTDALD
jgi:hypothetical protein